MPESNTPDQPTLCTRSGVATKFELASEEWNRVVLTQPGAGMSILHNQQVLEQAVAGAQLAKSVAYALRDGINSAFQTISNILLEEVVLTFRTRSGEDLLINPFDQASIDTAKAAAPGEGVGPAVSAHLVALMGRGLITDASLLPAEYRHLSALIGTSPAQAEALLANCNTKIQFDKGH